MPSEEGGVVDPAGMSSMGNAAVTSFHGKNPFLSSVPPGCDYYIPGWLARDSLQTRSACPLCFTTWVWGCPNLQHRSTSYNKLTNRGGRTRDLRLWFTYDLVCKKRRRQARSQYRSAACGYYILRRCRWHGLQYRAAVLQIHASRQYFMTQVQDPCRPRVTTYPSCRSQPIQRKYEWR